VRDLIGRLVRCAIISLFAAFLYSGQSSAQTRLEPGHSIGRVSVNGNLIVMELDDGALGKANPFDLVGRTLRFIPQGSRYRVENGPLQWVSEFGPGITGAKLLFINLPFLSRANAGTRSPWEPPDRSRFAPGRAWRQRILMKAKMVACRLAGSIRFLKRPVITSGPALRSGGTFRPAQLKMAGADHCADNRDHRVK